MILDVMRKNKKSSNIILRQGNGRSIIVSRIRENDEIFMGTI